MYLDTDMSMETENVPINRPAKIFFILVSRLFKHDTFNRGAEPTNPPYFLVKLKLD